MGCLFYSVDLMNTRSLCLWYAFGISRLSCSSVVYYHPKLKLMNFCTAVSVENCRNPHSCVYNDPCSGCFPTAATTAGYMPSINMILPAFFPEIKETFRVEICTCRRCRISHLIALKMKLEMSRCVAYKLSK